MPQKKPPQYNDGAIWYRNNGDSRLLRVVATNLRDCPHLCITMVHPIIRYFILNHSPPPLPSCLEHSGNWEWGRVGALESPASEGTPDCTTKFSNSQFSCVRIFLRIVLFPISVFLKSPFSSVVFLNRLFLSVSIFEMVFFLML